MNAVARLLLSLIVSIPTEFQHPHFDRVVWIAADRAVLSDTQKELLQKGRRQTARQREKEPAFASGCDVMFFGQIEDSPDLFAARSWNDLHRIASSRTVFEGAVTATAIGLRNGLPYAVLRIESGASSPVFLLYPDARLQLDGMTICNIDRSYAPRPSVGDRIVFPASLAADASGTLYHVSGDWIIYEHHGAIVTGPALRSSAEIKRFKSTRDVAAALRAAAVN
ncbi:MAG TPA: hypothetical protein VEK11_00395 [Thermoanaerobaculia bacterium]|nr:hypothetical protein [Thermoanaerobaculia bacterium]